MNTYPTQLLPTQAWPRPYLIRILEAGLAAKETTFTRQAALAWLASYPGDLPVRLIHARGLILGELTRQALPILQNIVQADPEFSEAQQLLDESSQIVNNRVDEVAHNCAFALGGIQKNLRAKMPKPDSWGHIMVETRLKLAQGDLSAAESNVHNLLSMASHTPLTGILHLYVLMAKPDTPRQSILSLAEHYHQRWPNTLQFMLILADVLMEGRDTARAVALLHSAASRDVTGQVAIRLWGPHHAYRNLWPSRLTALISIQIPASVSAYMGWNLLPFPHLHSTAVPPFDPDLTSEDSSEANSEVETAQATDQEVTETSGKKTAPEKPTTVKSELNKAKNHVRKPKAEGLFPVYVVFSTLKGLRNKYGVETAGILDETIRELITTLRKRLDWGATLIYADDSNSMAQFDLKPVPPDDPWKLKLALVDLDDALSKRGARIGAILIVGGPDVVPFHQLPNPTDDNDAAVPSDNPYATRDENYFIPEWPVGRLPDGSEKDPGLLLSTLRSMMEVHANAKKMPKSALAAFMELLRRNFLNRRNRVRASFGYSAEVWKVVSSSIYRTIGDPRSLLTSPPDEVHRKKYLPLTHLSYFNLHGVPDSPEWFGQRDPQNGATGPDYPVALHPDDIQNGGSAPKVVFSEACYGAHIYKKSLEEALALKFLASGSQVVIGSTVISYGSVTPPLNAADLLGQMFWQFFKEGLPAGESLRRAKIILASEMHDRQGYLDGEDQKTLISFVLYGDPLAKDNDLKNWRSHKSIPRSIPLPEVKTICDRVDVPGTSEPIPYELIGYVKKIVEQYLPGMRDAQLSMSYEHAECCCDGHVCPTSQLGTKNGNELAPERRVVTLSKQLVRANQLHETYARVTLDKEGKMVKLTVSR